MCVYKTESISERIYMTNFTKGYKAFIIDNFRFLREVVIVSVTRDFCVIEYVDTGAVIRVRKSRLYRTKREANEKLPSYERTKGSHWDYYLNH